ncbi:MAG: hypothetical protein IPK82_38790 [Polyangiaceae bacterium]|nr:hypothetical protein [Polyangiaceae bacterium]
MSTHHPRRTRRRMCTLVVAVVFGVVAPGCGPRVPLPVYTNHDGEEPTTVPFPPPPPRPEVIPDKPASEGVVWIDGQWVFRARRWEWVPGSWETAPQGAKYAPPAVVTLSDGRLGWHCGKWRTGGELGSK